MFELLLKSLIGSQYNQIPSLGAMESVKGDK